MLFLMFLRNMIIKYLTPYAVTYAVIAIHSLVFHVANLYAQPKNQITQVDQIFQDGKRQPSCVDHRKQFAILFCERCVNMTLTEPFQVGCELSIRAP